MRNRTKFRSIHVPGDYMYMYMYCTSAVVFTGSVPSPVSAEQPAQIAVYPKTTGQSESDSDGLICSYFCVVYQFCVHTQIIMEGGICPCVGMEYLCAVV